MALAIAPNGRRHLKPWERSPWDERAMAMSGISLEDIAARHNFSNNHAPRISSSNAISNGMTPEMEAHMEEAQKFNEWYANRGIDSVVKESHAGFFGKVYDAAAHGLKYAANRLGKAADSLIPLSARKALAPAVLAASLLATTAVACGPQRVYADASVNRESVSTMYDSATGILHFTIPIDYVSNDNRPVQGFVEVYKNGILVANQPGTLNPGKGTDFIVQDSVPLGGNFNYVIVVRVPGIEDSNPGNNTLPLTVNATPTAAIPTVTPAGTAVATATPSTLGTNYANRLITAGYSSEVAQRIASLPSTPANISFSEEILMIGEKAGYARDDFVKRALPLLENEKLPDNKLVIVRDIDGDGKSNATEINAGTNILDKFNRLPADLESLAVLNDDLYAIVAGNNNLVYAFNAQNFKSLFRELREAPYADELMKRITNADPKENPSQAWNYKVRRDDQVLFSILGLSLADAKGWQFRFDNGSYHLKSWNDFRRTGDVNTIQIMPLDDAGINEWFAKREDAEFAMMQLWVPDGMIVYDISKWKRVAWQFADGHLGDYVYGKPSKETDELAWQAIRNNMDILSGKQKVNGLDQYANLRARTLSALDRTVHSYPESHVPRFRDFTDQENVAEYWSRQQWFPFVDRKEGNFVGKEFQRDIEPVLNGWKYFEIGVKLPYGVAMIDGVEISALEQDDVVITPIYTKALGITGYGMSGRYPEYTKTNGDHQILGYTIPQGIAEKLKDRKIYLGQIISLLSAINGAQQDGIPHIKGPPYGDIIWRNPNIKN